MESRVSPCTARSQKNISITTVGMYWQRLNWQKSFSKNMRSIQSPFRRLRHPAGANLERFHLIAPYSSDAARWIETDWLDQYTGNLYRVTTTGPHGNRETARVKTYG